MMHAFVEWSADTFGIFTFWWFAFCAWLVMSVILGILRGEL